MGNVKGRLIDKDNRYGKSIGCTLVILILHTDVMRSYSYTKRISK